LKRVAYHILFCLLYSLPAFSQTYFNGRVLDNETGKPIAGASIYFNNTSLGTTSNTAGEFSFSADNIINTELIVSSIGFETLIYKIASAKDLQRSYVFKLVKKEAMLQDVLILTDEVRRRYLRYFVENFLGITQEAAQSKLNNLNAVYFTSAGNEKNSFKAYSDTPLVIINKRLGYRVHFQLVEFYYNEVTGSTSFYGFTRYEEMGDKKRWAKNRKKMYYGSTLHFYRSLISNTLEKEFYSIFLVRKDTLKQRNAVSGRLITEVVDIGIPVKATQVITKDSTDNDLYIAKWKDRLMVQYNKEPAARAYLARKTLVTGLLPHGFRSYLTMKAEQVKIDKDGILQDPLSLLYSGYWIYEKAANLLPFNYRPD
jgi:hypothetical protein